MVKYTLYDGITKPKTIDVNGIVKARAYAVKEIGHSITFIGSVLIVEGINGKGLGEIRGGSDGKLRWCPRTTSTKTGYPTYKWAYHLNRDGTLGKKLGRL